MTDLGLINHIMATKVLSNEFMLSIATDEVWKAPE